MLQIHFSLTISNFTYEVIQIWAFHTFLGKKEYIQFRTQYLNENYPFKMRTPIPKAGRQPQFL